jgi:MinD-like ATPase involved in chromosome partitioning or flagellar assembly
MLITIGSAKGSPGVTTLALALTAVWPDRSAVLVEADASGGDLALRCRHDGGGEVATAPSLTSLAAATRGLVGGSSPSANLLNDHTQLLACGVRVVPGLLGPAQATAIEHLWVNVAAVAAANPGPVIADVGRISGSVGAKAFLDRSDVAVVVCQPTLESLIHIRSLLTSLAARGGHGLRRSVLLPVAVARHRHAGAAAADVEVVCAEVPALDPCIPIIFDSSAVEQLQRGANPGGRLAGSRLLRSASTLGERIDALQSPASGRRASAEAS